MTPACDMKPPGKTPAWSQEPAEYNVSFPTRATTTTLRVSRAQHIVATFVILTLETFYINPMTLGHEIPVETFVILPLQTFYVSLMISGTAHPAETLVILRL